MKYIRIKEINIQNKDKFDKYHYYFNNELKEIEVNKGFTLTKQVLSQIIELDGTTKISIIINVVGDKINYFVGYNNLFNVNFNNVYVEKIRPEEIKYRYRYEDEAYGVVNPSNINLKEINLIDELLVENKGSNFTLKIEIEKALNECNIEPYLSELSKDIEYLSSQSEININKQDNLTINLVKSAIGGENKSYKREKANEKKKLDGLREKYNVLATNQIKIKITTIKILSSDLDSCKRIKSKLIAYSRMNIGNSVFCVLRDKAYLDYIKYCTLDYIIPIVTFPISNVPGLTVSSECEYGADILPLNDNSIVLGTLNKNGENNIDINYDMNDLLMHTFVTGVTGSGKTSTIKKIISEIAKNKKPFLIMEPAKSEYKYLSNIYNIKRYRLGIETNESFRLNPFEFPENIHVQTHLDNIKSVFVAAFPMQGPMPYILETAFYNIYRKMGWDLISSLNIYSDTLDKKYLYPTLNDLYEEIDNVTDDVGYSKDLTDDVKGALKVRIGSLLSGAKGTMLSTNESSKIEKLLNMPSIIELESIGDSQEKVFLMGLILTSIYEYYISKGEYSDELQNLLVIEEAHRLLENTTSINNNEIADMKGKALENFNNILSEIRAYGQGIVVADQIPSKLSPDVIKNTNLKIIHRLYANDDRELVGHSIGLEKERIKGLINLEKGQAIVFHSKVYNPLKVDITIKDNSLLDKKLCLQNEEKVKLNFEKTISNNETLMREIIATINSYLISKEDNYNNFKIFIQSIIEKYYDLEIIEKYHLDINKIIKGIVVSYVKAISKHKGFILNYPREIELINKIDSSEQPLEDFKNNIDNYIKYQDKNAVYNLVSDYDLFRLLYKINNKTDYNLLLLVNKYGDEFKQGNYSLQNDVIKKLNLNNYFRISNLSEIVKSNLVDSLVLFYFNNSEVILNLYFNI